MEDERLDSSESSVNEQPDEKRAVGLRLAQFSIDHPVTILMIFASFMVLGAVSISPFPSS